MDQIYREYSEKYKHILHYAGIMKKENVLFENQEIIVLKDVKDYQDFDYSYFENCEIEKSCIYHKITYALAVLKKVENGIIVDQMKTVGWLNTVLDQHYSAYKTDLWYLHKGNWDKCYLEEHYDFLSAIEVYFYLFGKEETFRLLEDKNQEMKHSLKIIEELIKQYQKECQDDQYALLKHFLVLIFSQQLEKIEVEHKEIVFQLLKEIIELKSIVLPLLLLCDFYQKDFDEEWATISKEVDRNYLKEQIAYIPFTESEDYLDLNITDVLVYKDKIEKKKKSPIKPLALLILGAAILWYGANYINTAQSDTLSSVVIMLGLGVAAWGIVAFLVKKERYVYKPTGKVLKKHKVYVAANQSSRLYDILEQNRYDDLQSLTRSGQSNLSLEAYCSDDEQYALLQVMEFIPYNDVPMTPVKVCEGTQAKQVAYFLK